MDRKVGQVVGMEDRPPQPQLPQRLVEPQLPLSVDVRACVLREPLQLGVHRLVLGRRLLVPVVSVLGHLLASVCWYVRPSVQEGLVLPGSGPDAGPDAGPDSEPDSGPEGGPEGVPEAGAEGKHGVEWRPEQQQIA